MKPIDVEPVIEQPKPKNFWQKFVFFYRDINKSTDYLGEFELNKVSGTMRGGTAEEIAFLKKQLSGPDKWIRLGSLTIFMCIFGFFLWALFAPLDEGVVASGVVTVESNRKTIQHLEGGIIKEILVIDGQQVEQNQVLMVMEQTKNRVQMEQMQGKYFADMAHLNRLDSETKGLTTVKFDDELLARASDPKIRDIMAGQQSIIEASANSRKGQIGILNQKINQLEEQIRGLNSNIRGKRDEQKIISGELERAEKLFQKKLIENSAYTANQKQAMQINAEIGQIEASISSARVQIAETKQQILQLERESREKNASIIQELQDRIFATREEMRNIHDIIERTEIRAPQAGKIINLKFHTIGGVIPPSSPIMEIVPSNDKLILDCKVRVNDIQNVKVGQVGEVKFITLPQKEVPFLQGEVVNISADVQAPQGPPSALSPLGAESFYAVKVSVSDEQLAQIKNKEIIPGMPVTVFLKGKTRTAMEYFLDPFKGIGQRAMTEH